MTRTASGWSDDHEFTTTFGTLKRSMLEAAEAERERIIALLEGESDSWRDSDYDAHYGAERCIALIKGENK